MSNHSIDVDIRVNDKTLRLYPHNGNLFVEAKSGSEYTIKIKNNNSKRVLAIVTVDGINVISGDAGGKSLAGYVINGSDSLHVRGFRRSNESVNAFRFNSKEKSYAAKSDATEGDTSNCGVIGVIIYNEKEQIKPQIERVVEKEYIPYPYPIHPIYPSQPTPWNQPTWVTYTSTCSLGDITNEFNINNSRVELSSFHNTTSDVQSINYMDMGTEWSKTELDDKVVEVPFEIGIKATTFIIYYASRKALIAMGVPIIKETKVSFPDPFPNKFCKPPTE